MCFRVIACALLICAGCMQPTFASYDVSPSAFEPFPTYGLAMTPVELASGQLAYTLAVSSGAYLLSDEGQFLITDVWGFYAVNKAGGSANSFTATGSNNGEWAWDQQPVHGSVLDVAGWLNPSKSEALVTPQSGTVSKQFTYTGFSFSGKAPVMGLHVSVLVPAGAQSPFSSGASTGFMIPLSVPEPSSALALLTGALGSAGLFWSRKRR